MPTSVKLTDLELAFEYVSSDGGGMNQAVLCRTSGKIYWQSDYDDELEELPEDIDDDEKYIPIPDKKELDLGKRLVLRFARERIPDHFDEVDRIFSRKGAYGRFKDFLVHRNKLQEWYDFEAKAQKEALREWCEDNDILLDESGNAPEQASSGDDLQAAARGAKISAEPKAILSGAEPQLFVADVKASADFFHKLGFSTVFLYGNPAFYGQVKRDNAALDLRCVDRPAIDPALRDREELLSAAITVDTAEEIEALFREFQAAGVPFYETLQRQPWGARNFIIKDPDGNLVLFAGPAE
jgi:catechol 2,3-dioxygenase-like lactoylglutathione lyase family enzyme